MVNERGKHQPKPAHLSRYYADQFLEHGVAQAYRFRPQYPLETFELLANLIRDEPRRVLDIGCGTGFIARNMVAIADSVDAVDMSAAMIQVGRELPNGRHPKLRWIHSTAEDAALTPPYALVVAGQSLHWMDWGITLARVDSVLTQNGNLAIVELITEPSPWDAEMLPIIQHYSTNQDFARTDLVHELQRHALFEPSGRVQTQAVEFVQPISEAVAAFHSRNGFTHGRMTPENASAFDHTMSELLAQHCAYGMVHQMIKTQITWGKPTHRTTSV